MRTTLKRCLPLAMRSLWSASAAAQSYYWPENKPGTPGAMATYVYVASAYLPANTTYTFETRNLSLGANTVMHLTYNSLTNEVAYNDDCPNSGSLRSCFTYRTPVAGTYYVIVYAYDANSGGRGGKTFDMYINNAVYAANVRLGGYVIYTTQGNWESMETVLVNDGAPATSLTRLDWNAGAGHYKPAAVDWTYGVGNASKLFGNGSSKWVVASASAATREGPVRVMRNDALLPNDSDGDGLGDNLERELCTCASKQAGIVCGFDCSTVVDPRDTDGDGLRDDWEAIGVDDPTNPQLFPLWGASPRHKDVFVEIDRSNWTGNQGQQFLDSDAQAAAQRYAALTGMGNPDGVDGIAVHFDVDHTCTETGDVDGISKVCGQFGGAGLLSTDPGCVPGSNMASIRGGKFHWGLLKTNAGGTTPVTPGQSFCFGPDPVWATAAHELGHNLGLQHWGVDAAGIANTKPNYPSLMNYAYSYKLNGGDVNSIAFSDGSRAGVPLNPRNLTEVSTYPVGVNIDFLAAEPFAFPRSGNGLDWNRDGDYNGSVRAHISPEPEYRDWGDGAADQPVNMSWQTLSTLVPTAGLGAAGAVTWDPIEQMFFNATFVIAQDPATYQYNYAYTIALTGGWSGWNLVGTATHDVNSAPAAAVLNTIPNGDLLFIFGATGGAIHYATVDLYRNVSAWSTPFTNPPGVAFSEVSVTPYSGPAGSVLFLVARDRSGTPNNVWFGTLNRSLAWSGWTQAMNGASAIQSKDYTPGVAGGPDGRVYMAVKAPVGDPRVDNLILWVYTGTTWQSFTALQQSTIWHGDSLDVRGRPAMVFRWFRDGHGGALPNGALWAWYSAVAGGEMMMHYRFSRGKFNATNNDFGNSLTMGRWQWPGHKNPATQVASLGLAPGVDGTLAAFAAYTTAQFPEVPGITHIPYADGEATPTRLLNDWNDSTTMKASLCPSIGCAFHAGMAATAVTGPIICTRTQ